MPRHVYLFSGASAVGKTSALKALLPLLEEGGRMNPGPWIRHSKYVAEAAGKLRPSAKGWMRKRPIFVVCFMTLDGGSGSVIWRMSMTDIRF